MKLYTEEQVISIVHQPDCSCDNCFYGRARLANYIIDNVKPTL